MEGGQDELWRTHIHAVYSTLFSLHDHLHSHATHILQIQGGSIANVISGCINRHPYADRPLLDFSLILMMEPTTIVGKHTPLPPPFPSSLPSLPPFLSLFRS